MKHLLNNSKDLHKLPQTEEELSMPLEAKVLELEGRKRLILFFL